MRKLARGTVSVGGHIGYHRSNWRPESERFAIGYRAGVLVYNVANTVFILKRAFGFVECLVYKYGKLFTYGIKKYKNNFFVKRFTRLMQIVATRDWRGGYVTNYKRFKARVRNFRKRFSSVLSFLYDYQNYSLPRESKLIKTPSICPVDSNATGEIFSFPIPINSQNPEAPKLLAHNFAWNIFNGLSKRLLSRFKKRLKSKKDAYPYLKLVEPSDKHVKIGIKKRIAHMWRFFVKSKRRYFNELFFKKFRKEETGDYTYHKGEKFITIQGLSKRLKELDFVKARQKGRKKLKKFITKFKETAKRYAQNFMDIAKSGKLWIWESYKKPKIPVKKKPKYKFVLKKKYKYKTKYKYVKTLLAAGKVQTKNDTKRFWTFREKKIGYRVKYRILVKIKTKYKAKIKKVTKKKIVVRPTRINDNFFGRKKGNKWWKPRKPRFRKNKRFWFFRVQQMLRIKRIRPKQYRSNFINLALIFKKRKFAKIYEKLKSYNPKFFFRHVKKTIGRSKIRKFLKQLYRKRKSKLLTDRFYREGFIRKIKNDEQRKAHFELYMKRRKLALQKIKLANAATRLKRVIKRLSSTFRPRRSKRRVKKIIVKAFIAASKISANKVVN